MVGDLAIFMVQNRLTPENILEKGEALTFPDSVVSYFKGMMGQPEGGFPPELQKLVLKGEQPITCRPGSLLEPVDFDAARKTVEQFQPCLLYASRQSSRSVPLRALTSARAADVWLDWPALETGKRDSGSVQAHRRAIFAPG